MDGLLHGRLYDSFVLLKPQQSLSYPFLLFPAGAMPILFYRLWK